MSTTNEHEATPKQHLDIAIRIKNGVAIITGTANTLAEKAQAERAAHTMVKASHVHNLVKV